MTEKFTSINLYVYIGSAWVDLTADVVIDASIRGSRGMKGNEMEDRVADSGTLEFTLNNSTTNSAGLLGYYSPGHTNCLSGWKIGLPVLLTFSYDTWTVKKWSGYIQPDGIKPIPGLYGPRRVEVKCWDYIGLISRRKIDLLPLSYNKYASQAMDLVLANLPIQPRNKDYLDETANYLVMPVVFDITNPTTTALGEFQKIAASQRLYIYVSGGGPNGETLTTNTQTRKQMPLVTAQSDYLLLEDGTSHLLLEDGTSKLKLDMLETFAALNPKPIVIDSDLGPATEIDYGHHIMNSLTVMSYPRRHDSAATTVLWTMEKAMSIGAGETTTIRGAYHDPNGGSSKANIDNTNNDATTEFKANSKEDGTGVDKTSSFTVLTTYGSAEAELTITNNGVAAAYIGGETAGAYCRVKGKGIYIFDTIRELYTAFNSIVSYGEHPGTVELKYQDNPAARTFSPTVLINTYKDPQYCPDRLDLLANRSPENMTKFLFLEPRNYLYVTESVTGLDKSVFYIQGYEFEVTEKSIVTWYPVLKEA